MSCESPNHKISWDFKVGISRIHYIKKILSIFRYDIVCLDVGLSSTISQLSNQQETVETTTEFSSSVMSMYRAVLCPSLACSVCVMRCQSWNSHGAV